MDRVPPARAAHPPADITTGVRYTRPALGYLLVATAAVLWGCWSLFLRPAGLSGAAVALVLFGVMAVPAAFTTRRPLVRDRRSAAALLILGLCDAGNAVLYFEALRRGPIAVAVLTHYLAPLLVALLAPLLLGERRSPRALLAAPVSLAGLALVIYQPGSGFPLITALLGTGSAVFYAANVLASKEAARAYSPIEVTALHAIVSAAVLLLLFRTEAIPAAPPAQLAWVLAGTLLCGLFANTLFVTGLKRVPSAAAGALTYLEPLTAAVVGVAVFLEPIGPWGVLGGVAVLVAGAWVAMQPPAATR